MTHKYLRLFTFVLVYLEAYYSHARANRINLEAETLADSGHARVKKGGAIDSVVSDTDLTSSSDLLLFERRSHKGGQMTKLNYLTSPSSSQFDSTHIHPHQQFRVNFKSHGIDEHFAKDKMRLNRFYYFNDQLPATRLSQFSPNRNFERQKPKLRSLKVSPKHSHHHGHHRHDHRHKWSKYNKKRNVRRKSKRSKSRFWNPLLVQNNNGPYHWHLPIHSETPSVHVKFKDLLQLATIYKNPLDFNFAPPQLTKNVHYSLNDEVGHRLSRKRRGLGSWLKSFFHIKKKTTPAPSPPPRPPSPPPPPPPPPPTTKAAHDKYIDDYYDDYPINVKYQKDGTAVDNEESKSVKYIVDQHGDTEIDWLLPKSLRKSALFGSIKSPSSQTTEQRSPPTNRQGQLGRRRKPHQNDYNEDETNLMYARRQQRARQGMSVRNSIGHKEFNGFNKNGGNSEDLTLDHRTSSESDQRKQRLGNFENVDTNERVKQFPNGEPNKRFRSKYGIFDMTSDFAREEKPAEEPISDRLFDNIGKLPIIRGPRKKRSLVGRLSVGSPKLRRSGSAVLDRSEPIEIASKEELRLLHELFMNIVNGKCPQSFDSQFVDTVELNLFKIIDSSRHISTDDETSADISKLIHELVNCSIVAERERDSLEMMIMQDNYGNYFSNTNDIEEGGPLYRSKRKFLKDEQTDNYEQNSKSDLSRLSNFEFSLVTFVGEQCSRQVNSVLLHSASQLILDTITTYFTPFMRLTEEKFLKNFNILQNCAGLIKRQRIMERKLKRKLQKSINLFSLPPYDPLTDSLYYDNSNIYQKYQPLSLYGQSNIFQFDQDDLWKRRK